VFTRRDKGNNTGLLICLDLPEIQQKKLSDELACSNSLLPTLHLQILKTVWKLYDNSVWSLRDRLRAAEKVCNPLFASIGQLIESGKARDSSANFIYLHELARHLIHSNETLDVAMDTLDAIRESFKVIGDETEKQYFDEQTYALRRKFRALRSRSESLKERLQNEINLVREQIIVHCNS